MPLFTSLAFVTSLFSMCVCREVPLTARLVYDQNCLMQLVHINTRSLEISDIQGSVGFGVMVRD